MDKVKVLGLIVGIVGLVVLFFLLITDLTSLYDIVHNAEEDVFVFANTAILWSVALTLGATGAILYAETKAVFFMGLATLLETVGFALNVQRLGSQSSVLVTVGVFTTIPMLISTILLAIPRKRQT